MTAAARRPSLADHSVRGEGSWQTEAINGVTGEGQMKERVRIRTCRCIVLTMDL